MRKGQKHTEESKRKNRKSCLGREVSVETREKIRKSRLGKKFGPMSEQGRKNISIALKGLCVGEKNSFYGCHHTDAVKEKLSKLYKGKVRGPMKNETKEKLRKCAIEQHNKEIPEERLAINKKISENRNVVTLSKEWKQNIGKGNKGKVRTPEQRLKYRESKIGEKNPSYINGHYKRKIYKYIRELKEYKEWRLKVFERDEYICRECGKKNCELNAHHIVPFVKLIENIKDNAKEELLTNPDKYKKLWDIDNGATLCLNCHKNIHRRGD